MVGLLFEVQKQVYGVPDRPSHERGGPDLADQPGGLGGRLVEQRAVALQYLHVRPPGSRQVVGGAQPPDAASNDHNAIFTVHSVPLTSADAPKRPRMPGRAAGSPQLRSLLASV